MDNDRIDNLGIAIGMVDRNFKFLADRKVKALGLSGMEGTLLNNVNNHPLQTQDFHAGLLGYDKGTLARKAESLEKMGLIFRKRDENNKRKYLLEVTPRGKDLAEKVCDMFLEAVNIMTESLTDEERKLVLHCLDKMSNQLEQAR